jgi:hypothetical protein
MQVVRKSCERRFPGKKEGLGWNSETLCFWKLNRTGYASHKTATEPTLLGVLLHSDLTLIRNSEQAGRLLDFTSEIYSGLQQSPLKIFHFDDHLKNDNENGRGCGK